MVTPSSEPQQKPQTEPRSTLRSNPETLSWYTVPEAVKQQLMLASTHWDHPELADGYMKQALALAGDHPDVLVSAYRYFFYTHNNKLALQVAAQVLDRVKQIESLPDDWAQIKPILLDRRDDPNIRLYVNAYAASGLILARLGEFEAARQIAVQVSEVEARNEFGGNVVRDILDHPDEDGDEDRDENNNEYSEDSNDANQDYAEREP